MMNSLKSVVRGLTVNKELLNLDRGMLAQIPFSPIFAEFLAAAAK
jgi:hypothetical protein